MKRSEINRYLQHAIDFFAEHRFELPPFGQWTSDQWQTTGTQADEIRQRKLGWDLTDFGVGDFEKLGLLLFTIRNGNPHDPTNEKVYAEKILIVREQQIIPWHYHAQKTEDIINRGGGNLIVQLQNVADTGDYANTPIAVSCDGVTQTVEPGGKVTLTPGESITLVPKVSHMFYGQPGAGTVLVGEVSSVNDDAADNFFKDPLPRFPEIEEDEVPLRLLCNEYPDAR